MMVKSVAALSSRLAVARDEADLLERFDSLIWAGDPSEAVFRPGWTVLSQEVDLGITWGHLALCLPSDLYTVLRMLAGAIEVVEFGNADVVTIFDVNRCVISQDTRAVEVDNNFFVSRGSVRCRPSEDEGTPCPNSSAHMRTFDWCVLSVGTAGVSAVKEVIQFGLDHRVCRSLADLTEFVSHAETAGRIENVIPFDQVLLGESDEHDCVAITFPRADFLGQKLSCGHLPVVDSESMNELLPFSSKITKTTTMTLPGGLDVDAEIRQCVSDALIGFLDGRGDLPPDPVTEGPSIFYQWLESPASAWHHGFSRYWEKVWSNRQDLMAAFPNPESSSASEFRCWCEERYVIEGTSSLISVASNPENLIRLAPQTELKTGINLIGYLNKISGLGEASREICRCITENSIPLSLFPYWRSASDDIEEARPPFVLNYARNVFVISPLQHEFLIADTPEKLWDNSVNIGFWFWEVPDIPESFIEIAASYDEIWVATDFIHSALQGRLSTPVKRVRLPLPRLDAENLNVKSRSKRFRFLAAFDFNSVFERKNPVGVIEAFKRAFPEVKRDGPELLVKTINGWSHPAKMSELMISVRGRQDIQVRDESLSRESYRSLLLTADCYVSLHRSEGLGLMLAEAMELGIPTIATGYSGNVDFMTAENSYLVDFNMVPIGEVPAYGGLGEWADPDEEDAAHAMRKLFLDDELRGRLSRQAIADIRRYRAESEVELGVELRALAQRLPLSERR